MFNASFAGVALAAATTLMLAASPARAGSDTAFFDQVVGQWSGRGEIVAGKYKGTKFNCSFSGETPGGAVGMSLDGTCRVGLFSQKMRAEVTKQGVTYKGAFLDGAKGKGLDIISGNVAGNQMVVGLDRKQLKGAMIAKLDGRDKLSISISVRVADDLVPVLGMSLARGEAMIKQTALEQ
ncbi:hypothetical protein Sa4125_26330 [Aureimonas sp. SA4125]|uniref:hypothetical protein n=1 Tax=Aureimonas sp. SA4125 TaxID=2826993 RepID=UPI001CC7920A|nr:hypothetical protein [Aureimonas sp. SA4125]BDA85091.1 hypothetical protein Sa4125_26330 [Aureimonas sp. SA4125]